MNRREIMMAGACVLTAGTAYALTPHKRLNLLGNRKMADVIPMAFGDWSSRGDDGLVKPETEGKLAARLYSETVSRSYTHRSTGDEIMMLVAYGDTQSDLLQLHRPESCYPAIGFHLAMSQAHPLPLRPNALLPSRRVVAERSDRVERIVYWTRLGEYLPVSGKEQRAVRLRTAMKGLIPDGGLFRFSTVRDNDDSFPIVESFIASLVLATKPDFRSSLVGTALSRKLSA
jgi:EpsI family protein